MKKKIILVTGSSGFIGKFFIKRALKKGYLVIDIQRNNKKRDKDLVNLKKEYSKTYNSIYYSKYQNLNKMLKNKKFDYFINFATFYKNHHTNKEILNFIDSNIIFPSVVLDTIIHNTKKIINFGTMMQHTSDKKNKPKNFYASSKSAFEIIMKYLISLNKKTKFYNLKFYESYAEVDSRKKLLPTLFNNFKKKKKTLINSKKLELNILHVDDILNAIDTVLNNNIKSGDYCLMQKKNIKIKDFILKINKKSKKKLLVVYQSKMVEKPKKTHLKILPKWKADITIQKKIEKKFLNENN